MLSLCSSKTNTKCHFSAHKYKSRGKSSTNDLFRFWLYQRLRVLSEGNLHSGRWAKQTSQFWFNHNAMNLRETRRAEFIPKLSCYWQEAAW